MKFIIKKTIQVEADSAEEAANKNGVTVHLSVELFTPDSRPGSPPKPLPRARNPIRPQLTTSSQK